jgi:predicted Zn-dependent protease
MSALALSEAALARGDVEEALDQADRAQQQLPSGSVGYLRAQDIIAEAQRVLRNR